VRPTSHPVRIALVLLLAGSLLAACGGDTEGEEAGAPSAGVAADQTVEVRMLDIKFEPADITVPAGKSIRFVFKNDGKLLHNAAFGDEATQQAVGDGKARRDGPEVSPNQSKDYVRTFSSPGTLVIGCHVAGHFEAGMKIRLTVV
jgi:uncharacterized cupredoxin-like copper-binding protein